MKIVGIVQARMGSTRLPGKVLLPLNGSTVLGQVIGRMRRARRLATIWIATSRDPDDDAIQAEAERLGVPCFRGSAEDVLERYHGAAHAAGADVVVRVTSDCPFFDGALLDEMIAGFLAQVAADRQVDCYSNVIERTFPRGLDAEIFRIGALDRAFREAGTGYEREHVTPYFYRHPEFFTLQSHKNPVDLSRHRWTLDTPDDWNFVQSVYSTLGRESGNFTTADVLNLLDRQPEILELNAHIEQKKEPLRVPPPETSF